MKSRINGKYKRIRPNLHAALRAVKRSGLTFGEDVEPETWIWIDALSINQDDDEEKAVQVQIMDRIFSAARAVVVWLGKPARHTNLAVEYFKYVHAEWRIDLVDKELDAQQETPGDH